MEASEALGGGEQAQTGTEGAAQGAEQAAEIPQALADRFSELDRSFGERFGQLESALGQLSPGQEAGGQEHGESGGEPDLFLNEQTGEIVDQFGRLVDPSTLGRDGNGGLDPKVLGQLQTQMQQQMQEALAPIMEHFEDQQAADLEDRYPQFRDAKYAEKIVSAAEERAAAYGKPELARSADFIELLHLAEIGQQRAADQQTAGGASETGVALETDGVTNAGQSEADPGDRIVQAGAQRSGFFSG